MFPGRVGDTAIMQAGLPSLLQEMAAGKINTPRRVAAFLTTVAHESGLEYNARQRGDAHVFGGRGFIQLTGSENYAAARSRLKVDLLRTPDLALSLEWSARIARWYWAEARDCNALADELRIGKVNAAIGYPVNDGKEDAARCASFKKALQHLTGSVPDGIDDAR